MNNLRIIQRIILLAVVASVVLLLGSCEEIETVSVDERINMFFNDLSADRTSTLKGDHISPQCSQYDSIDSGTWDTGTWSSANRPFTVNTTNIPDNTTVIVSVTYTASTENLTIYMHEDEDDLWRIQGINNPNGSDFGP